MRLLIAAAAATFLATPVLAASSPPSGYYIASIYVVQAEGSGCYDYPQSNLQGVFDFQGLSGKKFSLREVTGNPFPEVWTYIFTTTDGSGTTSQSGNFTGTGQGGQNHSLSGTFQATFIEIDKSSFATYVTEEFDNCQETISVALTTTGAKN